VSGAVPDTFKQGVAAALFRPYLANRRSKVVNPSFCRFSPYFRVMSTREFEGLSNSDVWGSSGPKVTPTGVKALYIANIGRAPQRDIEKLVEPYGKVQRIEMKSNYCFVYFSEDTAVEAYEHAIAALNGQRLGSQSRILTAEWARGTAPASISRLQESEKTLGGEDSITGGDGACLGNSVTTSKTLFVVNFDPDEITSRDLLIHFHRFGPIERIERRKHFAFIEFRSLDDAIRARSEMDGAYIGCRQVSVEFSQKGPPAPNGDPATESGSSTLVRNTTRTPWRQGLDTRRPRSLDRSTRNPSWARRRRRSYSPPLFPAMSSRRQARMRNSSMEAPLPETSALYRS